MKAQELKQILSALKCIELFLRNISETAFPSMSLFKNG